MTKVHMAKKGTRNAPFLDELVLVDAPEEAKIGGLSAAGHNGAHNGEGRAIVAGIVAPDQGVGIDGLDVEATLDRRWLFGLRRPPCRFGLSPHASTAARSGRCGKEIK